MKLSLKMNEQHAADWALIDYFRFHDKDSSCDQMSSDL